MKRSIVASILILCISVVGAWADYTPPTGGGAYDDLASPEFLMSGPSVVAGGSPHADTLNPAVSGDEQRPIIDLNAIVLAGLGTQTGAGTSVNLGVTIPTRVGVFTGSGRFVYTAPGLTSVNLGTLGALNFSFSKQLYPNLLVGVGLGAMVGKTGTDPVDFGVGLDLGILHRAGDLAVFKDFTWGIAIRDMGKAYTPVAGSTGLPGAFTLAAGLSFDLVQTPVVTWGFDLDVSFPSFQNVRGNLSTKIGIKDIAFLTVGSHFDLHEILGTFNTIAAPRTVPVSFGLSFRIKTDIAGDIGLFRATERGWNRSEINIHTAAAPLQSSIWAFGLGVNMRLGEIDVQAPEVAYTAPEVTYISPEVEGTSDELELPITIGETRYVKGYQLTISDASGATVRTIGDAEVRSEKVFDRLAYVQAGVEVPEKIVWDGKDDGDTPVPDGAYSYELESWDDNDNRASSQPATVVVDNTPPAVDVSSSYLVFSPNSDGNKDVLPIEQSGSSEDEWSASITDTAGTVVRQFTWGNSAPQAFDWDGMTEGGLLAPDGTYTYSITATDRAGNTTTASLAGISINTRPTPVTLYLDKSFFSPNADGIKDGVTITLDVPVTEGMIRWNLDITDAGGTAVRGITGADTMPPEVNFDGSGDTGSLLPEGTYRAALDVLYENGNNPTTESSPFTLDLTSPSVTAKAEHAIFSPNGDGKKDTVTIFQDSSEEVQWHGRITDSAGTVISTINWRGRVDSRLVWNGRGPEGQLLPDGIYRYMVFTTDRAGNYGESAGIGVELNTEDTQVFVSTDLQDFSPNADGVKDKLRVLPQLRVEEGIKQYDLKIRDTADGLIRSYSPKSGVPSPYVWDGITDGGSRTDDGEYYAEFHIVYTKGDEHTVRSTPFVVDTQAPEISLSADFDLFSPDGDSYKDAITVTQESSEEDLWEAEFRDAEGRVVRTMYWKRRAAPFGWDGRDDIGNKIPDGLYSYAVAATDKAGNSVSRVLERIEIDTRETPVYLSVTPEAFSPNGDRRIDTAEFRLILGLKEGIESWQLDVDHQDDGAQKSFRGGSSIPASITWDGTRGAGGKAPEGRYIASLHVEYRKGNQPQAQSMSFILDTAPPEVDLSVSPSPFSPDDDGKDDVLTIATAVRDISGIDNWILRILDPRDSLFKAYAGKGTPPKTIRWDGISDSGRRAADDSSYSLMFFIEDKSGNSYSATRTIDVDVELPAISASIDITLFSPDGDGNRDEVRIQQQSTSESSWTGEMRNASGRVIRSWSWSGRVRDLVWDGKDRSGNVAPNGVYTYSVRSARRADIVAEAEIAGIEVDSRFTSILTNVSADNFSPNNDGKKDTIRLSLYPSLRDGVSTWEVAMVHETLGPQMIFSGEASIPASITWSGDAETGRAPEGRYTAEVSVVYEKGNRPTTTSKEFVLDVTPPEVDLVLDPLLFSPDDDGTDDMLSIRLEVRDATPITGWKLSIQDPMGQYFVDYSSKGSPPRELTWNGYSAIGELVQAAQDYPLRFTIEDSAGNARTVEGLIPIDVLVIRDGDKLKIRISGITFPGNSADLDAVRDPEKIDLNVRTLARIAEILKKFSTYKIRIEGHANNLSWYDEVKAKREQEEELLPLSRARADAVRDVLVGHGLPMEMFTTAGLGGSAPLVPFSDTVNRWKNRRVEFILVERK